MTNQGFIAFVQGKYAQIKLQIFSQVISQQEDFSITMNPQSGLNLCSGLYIGISVLSIYAPAIPYKENVPPILPVEAINWMAFITALVL